MTTSLELRYELGEILGRGGMSTVYRAYDRLRGEEVALKLLDLDHPLALEAFRNEFRILSRLYHPRLVEVYDFGQSRQGAKASVYYTARLVHGTPIDSVAHGRAWSRLRIAFADGLRALAALHRAGLRHGDFTPHNLLVDEQGRGTLIDLGCSRVPGGNVAGTPGFMAPEVIRGDPWDSRADLFAAGVTLHRLQKVCSDMPDDVTRLAEQLTRADRADRPADVAEVLLTMGEHPDATPVVPSVPPALYGRRAVLAAWQELMDGLAERRTRDPAGSHVLFLRGPHGSGRTRILDECKWLAEPRISVMQGNPRHPDGLHALLRCALNDPGLPGDLTAVWRVRLALANRSQPVVLVLDDAQELGPEQRALLFTLMASLRPSDPLGLLLSGSELDGLPETGVERMDLEPLTKAELRSWIGPHASERFLAELERVTQGLPGHVATLLGQVHLGNEDLSVLAGGSLGRSDGSRALERLDAPARRALSLCVALGGHADPDLVRQLTGDEGPLQSLHQLGWIARDQDGVCLTRPWDLHGVAQWLGEDDTRWAHRCLLEYLETHPPTRASELAYHAALAGDHERAENLLLDHRAEFTTAPSAYRRAAEALLSARASPTAVLLAAELCELSGDPRRGLERVDACDPTGLEPDQAARLELRAGSCLYRLGDGTHALERLERALTLTSDPELRAEAADLSCRAHIQRGEYDLASTLARQAAEWTHRPAVLSALDENLAVAAIYLGQDETARTYLQRAEASTDALRPRRRVGLLSYRAIHQYRTGHYDQAERSYRQALAMAEEHMLADLAASCALNLGGLEHRCGRWGEALRSYERGQALASAMSKVQTSVVLKYNLAQLSCDLGNFDRAQAELDAARREAESAELQRFVALVPMLAGEIALRRGLLDQAREQLEVARCELAKGDAKREWVDAELHAAEVELQANDPARAEERLEVASRLIEGAGAEDLRTRWMLLGARALLGKGQHGAAVSLLERALPRAEQSGESPLAAELEGWLAHALEQQGARWAARPHRGRALGRWDRCLVDLPTAWHDRFWSHPLRAGLRAATAREAAEAREHEGGRVHQLERLLGIYRRLGSSLDTKDVLEYAMDAAVELTGAERGFLLVRRQLGRPPRDSQGAPTGFEVAVARNVDRETIGRSGMKLSHSIAERVIATSAPILTAEAQSDQRFAEQHSVLALGLKSVLCVPIPGPGGVLGALYVDNRFQRGRFTDAHQELLLAFADQVGIALNNARLHQDLERHARELHKERQRIHELLEERDREVDRLAEQMRLTQKVLDVRQEHAGIVGQSAVMHHVFALIDRVAESSFTLLIEGESGTGKELVARAVHQRGPQHKSPFVSINCAAVPEPLLESELFGHVRGAFTGAERDREGLFVHARDGTLLLDEIGELPLTMQAKLLRVLQEREVRPVGGTRSLPVRARVVCATNRHLRDEVAAGRFREDLFYRVAVVEIRIPPLRERPEDIPLLAEHLLGRLAREQARPKPALRSDAVRRLLGYAWPGNVRQLENVLSHAVLFCADAEIRAADIVLPSRLESVNIRHRHEFAEHEARAIAAALRASRWNVAEVSRTLEIPRTTLYRKLREYKLTRSDAEK